MNDNNEDKTRLTEPIGDEKLPLTQSESQILTKQNYGDKFQEHLLEQYKLFIEMMDRNSSRRIQSNNFYISILSSLLAFIVLITNKDISQFKETKFQAIAFITVAILGIILCLVWYVGIQSHKTLNSSKFRVINELERQLPYSCYEKEWAYLKKDKRYKTFLTSTSVDRILPIVLCIPYLGLLVYSLLTFF
ncbi:hypothetical protein [Nostoc sp. ChiQUE01b]|uniref:RipA family octameric membrane protein n=1 Tax=Nostoc sp. ChiQUE01b TaxID=3075376 RepID=UPI002AD579F3|nr:hypothetical protein [Nostoc sp. ChiQUE01b]MDZ8257347.1 hypothetical protein [Nostoc sp. ChiQUE01b]